MIFENPKLFEQAARELLSHGNHKLCVTPSGRDGSPDVIVVGCEDCHETLIEFLPESTSQRPDPDHVRYEAHYDRGLDRCHIEVFKPDKSPYPLQERQDIINHSPTGIAWGYPGSGPAQCAFALLMDYLGDEEQARALYQNFKFRVIARFALNSDWVLTGREIDSAISTLLVRQRMPSSLP